MKKTSLEELYRQHQPEVIAKRLNTGNRSQDISDAVLGAIDGCITTFAVVSGAFGAGFPASVALILGFANLLADGFSMAVSNYEAIKAQREFREQTRRMEEEHIDRVPDGEQEEVRQLFRQKGFEGETLEAIVETISQDRELWVETMLVEEHGLQKTEASPWRSAAVTFATFIFAGAIPLLPYFVPGLPLPWQFGLSAGLAAAVFFAIGMLKSLVFTKPLLISGLSTLLTGGTAAALAYLTGYLLRQAFGIL
ncbi:VIT1/CCC1 transporter family protein [Pseudomonas benzenivorans]|uniref:VIT1/CCC1 transporter family protein n=1 Tax=Pseudomonas benzenivorans TaxID=556533 RepID=A0ABY5H2S4_9PSED|nr:VIT1/CCC1 transporter family protein [Pseudomonas benzenivorans]UTW06598.1 VIT1/CCC1 transporter family protein [Pseudomonas benzenivorans]